MAKKMTREEYLAAQQASSRQQADSIKSGGEGEFRKIGDGDDLSVRLFGGSITGYDMGNPNATWCIERARHWYKQKPYPCRQYSINTETNEPFGVDCPMCQLAAAAKQAALSTRDATVREELKKLADDLYVNKKFIVPCVVTNDKKAKDRITLLEVPTTVIVEINKLMDEDTSLGIDPVELFDFTEGVAVVVSRAGTGFDTKYSVRATKPRPVHSSGDEDDCYALAKTIPEFGAFITVPGAEGDEYIDLVEQIIEDLEDLADIELDIEVEVDEAPAPKKKDKKSKKSKKRKPAKKVRRVEVEEEEEEDDADYDEFDEPSEEDDPFSGDAYEDDDDEPADIDDDEFEEEEEDAFDDDEFDDEEEEAPAPKRKKKKAAPKKKAKRSRKK